MTTSHNFTCVRALILALLPLATTAACVDGYVHESRDRGTRATMSPSDSSNTDGPEPSQFARRVADRVENYRDEGFEKLTSSPFPSSASQGKQISLYVGKQGVADYLAATSSGSNSSANGAEIPEGTTIVREIRDAGGNVEKLTLIAQRKESFHERVGGLWFGVMTPDGEYATRDGGVRAGALSSCANCHTTRSATDYLYGVPSEHLAVRTPGDSDDEEDAPDSTDSSEDETKPNDDSPRRSLEGYRISNRERDLQRTQAATVDSSAKLAPGDVAILARNASKAEFERYWGVELEASTTYVNMRIDDPYGAPIVNGGEIWKLQSPDGDTVDGETREGKADRAYQRLGFSGDPSKDWGIAAQRHATPGKTAIDADIRPRPGLFISEWSDAETYRMEFIELQWLPPSDAS